MSRTAYKFSAVIVSLLLSAMLAGCGASKREGATLGSGTRVADEATCRVCHSTTLDPVSATPIVSEFLVSSHNTDTGLQGCQGCHGGGTQHNGVGPIPYPDPIAANRCIVCHTTANAGLFAKAGTNFVGTCASCHTTSGTGGIHAAHVTSDNCLACHDVAINNAPQHRDYQNNGVRAVVGEFSKWSHHVTGVAMNSAHCAACHLEGTVANGQVVIDRTKHMSDGLTHLRNVDDDSDYQWDPNAPNHTTMDNFCMGCHDANGASSAMSVQIQAVINAQGLAAAGKTAAPKNPFGDTISNQYDKMARPAVVDVGSQFNTSNASHHGVKGPRYSGRTRVAGSRQIRSLTAFTSNSSANLPGGRSTIYDAGKFNANYVPLENKGGESAPRTGAATLGDDSTLHCGDCHTVGEWKPGVATNAAGVLNTVAIGAHGAKNEYMLRNSLGTDARHQGIQMDASAMHADGVTPYLVCYNCHAIANYGLAAHIGEQVVGENNCDTPTNTNTVNAVGTARLTSQYSMSYGANVIGTPTGATNGNIYGIQCSNCHNSGISVGNIFGGIHGSADPTYTDGAGNTTKHERFLPGLGNVKYAPGTRGGISGGVVAFQSYSSKVNTSGVSKGLRFKGSYAYTTGGVTNDANWEEKARIPVGDGVTVWSHNPGAAGCYTITEGADEVYNAESNGVPAGPAASKGLTSPDGTVLFGNWGGCADHSQQVGSSVRPPRSTNTSIRPVTY